MMTECVCASSNWLPQRMQLIYLPVTSNLYMSNFVTSSRVCYSFKKVTKVQLQFLKMQPVTATSYCPPLVTINTFIVTQVPKIKILCIVFVAQKF